MHFVITGKAWLAILLICFNAVFRGDAWLTVGFYSFKCPLAELIVRQEVTKAVSNDRGAAADLLRLHFHDCFAGDHGKTGCEGSVLIDSTKGNQAEKDAQVNQSLSGFKIIDSIKKRLEAICKGIVSCADILAFAARDSVSLTGGLYYIVPAGRRDGRVSTASDTVDIPVPTQNLSQLITLFNRKGLNEDEMIVLSGAHTIGEAHCGSFSNRLNRSVVGGSDPSLDPIYADQLEKKCSSNSVVVPMDPPSPEVFDTSYYKNLLVHRGLFNSDQSLTSTAASASVVRQLAFDPLLFKTRFADAMTKLGKVGILTGNQGEIRTNCRVVNP